VGRKSVRVLGCALDRLGAHVLRCGMGANSGMEDRSMNYAHVGEHVEITGEPH
jgi:hypothetical protein